MDRVFELLFKYRPLVFSEGDFTFAAPWSLVLFGAVAAIVVTLTTISYSRAAGETERKDRIVMATLRTPLVTGSTRWNSPVG